MFVYRAVIDVALFLLQEEREMPFRPISERNRMYEELNDVRKEITLYEPFHTLFDAGLWYVEPRSHQVVAMEALQSVHNAAASSIISV